MIYRRYLAQFSSFRVVRFLLLLTYRHLYQVYSLLRRNPYTGVYTWCSLSSLKNHSKVKRERVFDAESIDIGASITFLGHASEYVKNSYQKLVAEQPEQDLFILSSATAVGGIDVVLWAEKAIHHDLFQPGVHQCPAENVGVLSQFKDGTGLKLYLTKDIMLIPNAISLIGQCSGNYAHWLTETLPKLTIVNLNEEYNDWPLLVDSALHQNIYESIKLLNKNRRKIIKVDRWQPVCIEELIVISAPAYERYVPQGIDIVEPAPYENVFSRQSLELLRIALMRGVKVNSGSKKQRIYLNRSVNNANLRGLDNSKEVIEVLQRHSILSISPQQMSFEEQFVMCSNAELIIAPIGAALANMIFAPTGCNIIILSPYYEGASYNYYTRLAGVLGHKVTYILGSQVGANVQPMHRSYHVDVATLDSVLSKLSFS